MRFGFSDSHAVLNNPHYFFHMCVCVCACAHVHFCLAACFFSPAVALIPECDFHAIFLAATLFRFLDVLSALNKNKRKWKKRVATGQYQ